MSSDDRAASTFLARRHWPEFAPQQVRDLPAAIAFDKRQQKLPEYPGK